MSDRGRVALIVGAVAAVAGGGLFYLFKVHLPKKDRAAAQSEIETWEKRLGEARTCLLGEKPASGNSAEALSVRELMPDPWNRGTCTKLIGQLNRGPTNDTGIMPVERAWMSVERAAARVASSFATHVDPFGEKREDRGKESPLPGALQELDTAHAELRLAAGMSPPPSTLLPTLGAAEVIAVRSGAADIAWIDGELRPSAGGAVMFGTVKGESDREVVLAPGAAPKVAKLENGVVRAVPDMTWGAAAIADMLAIGPLDDASAFTTKTEVKAAVTSIFAIAGKATDGVVMFGQGGQLAFARATGGAPFATTGTPIPSASRIATAVDLAGRAAVTWTDATGALQGVILKDGAEPKVMPLGSADPEQRGVRACLTTQHAWVGDEPQFVRFDETAAQPHVLAQFALSACNDKFALLKKNNGVEYAVCAESCRMVTIPNLVYAAAAGLVGDQVVAMRAHRGVLGVYRENAPPTFYGFPGTNFEGWFAHSDGKVIDFVGMLDDKATILRVPAR